jgi:DNA-binding SARP family transcriptional activator
VRDAARLLVAARAGRLASLDVTPAALLTAFPLPWAVELAVHAEAAGLPAGRRLLRWLADQLGPVVHEMLPGQVREAAARRLLAAVPATPPGRTRIEVLGPLRVLVDGVVVHPPELRRRRVRELLELLALHGELYRARAVELLWPDLDPQAAARNLRVTLAYLRRALEPDRQGSHLRADRDRIRLAPSSSLEVDLAELRGHLDEARRAGSRGDPGAAGAELAAAVELWRGDPLTEVSDGSVRTAIQAELTAAALALGERRLAEGATAAARDLAQRVLAAEPYAERALRLLLAAATQHRDPAATAEAIDRVRDTLAGLGVAPQPATVVVLRQAHLAVGGVRLSAPRPVRPAR